MNTIRPCGCKGCRTCLQCENEFGIERKEFFQIYKKLKSLVFCPYCAKLYEGWDVNEIMRSHHENNHNNNKAVEFSLPGIVVKANFIIEDEGKALVKNLDELPWEISQSGRRKQNFGPKTNFKKRKVQNGKFQGFPKFSEFIQDRFEEKGEDTQLRGFQTIEQCTLEYDPYKGASIDPHIDDCWIWGERVVTVNCLGDSVLTLTKYSGDKSKYNLELVNNYRDKLIGELLSDEELDDKFTDVVVRIPMPNLSLIVLCGAARYQFEHSVLREDVKTRRVCLAYREFTPMYLPGGTDYEKGKEILQQAKLFWNHKEL